MAFTLELLHIADQEANSAAIVDAPNLSAVLNALKAQDIGNDGEENDNTLVLSSGDAFIPGLFFNAQENVFGAAGIADIQIQNELGIQAIALGNHEFDEGTQTLSELITGQNVTDGAEPQSIGQILGADFTGAEFPYLSTNLNFSGDEFLSPLEVEGGQLLDDDLNGKVTSSVVIDVNGEEIGVVGATTPRLASISSVGGVFANPSPFDADPTDAQIQALADEIQLEVDALLAANEGMNKVILLAHMQQISIEFALAEKLENVDIIVAGGSNTRLVDDNDRLRDGDSAQGDYPTFITNAAGTTTAVVNTDKAYKYVGRLVVEFDDNGNILQQSYDEDVSGAYATDAQGVADLGAEDLVDPEIQQIVDLIEAEIVATESNVFGFSNVFLNGNRSGTGEGDDPDGVRTQETNLGNLTADANLAEAKKVDPSIVVSLKNGGGIRDSVGEVFVPGGQDEAIRTQNGEVVDGDGEIVKPQGGISQNDIASVLAFNNGLIALTFTKQELVDSLEHGVAALPEVDGRFPQLAGVEFSFDPDQPAGDRVVDARVVDEDGGFIAELVRDGELVGDPNELFRIVTLDFLALPRFKDGEFIGAGDGYPWPNTNTDPEAGELADPDVLARVNPVLLEQEGVATGVATFSDDGTEQDALAEYLVENFGSAETAFDQADVGPEGDARIQNLAFQDGDIALPTLGDPTADTIRGENADDLIDGGLSGDRLVGRDGDDTLIGNRGADTLIGNRGDDRLDGGDARDLIFGRTGDDTLVGGRHSDTLIGGRGDDLLDGNSESNPLAGAKNTFVVGFGNDTITDIELSDDAGVIEDRLVVRYEGNPNARITNTDELIDYVDLLETDAADQTFARVDGDDLVLVFQTADATADGDALNSVRLQGLFVAGDITLTELEDGLGFTLDTLGGDSIA